MPSIFIKGQSKTPNFQSGYRKDFSIDVLPSQASITIGAQTFYRLFINGTFVMHGPARSPKGHQRMDTLDILPYLSIGINKIAVEISSYNYGCYYVPKEEGFFYAELCVNHNIIMETDTTWRGITLHQRDCNTEYYTHARGRNEAYHLDASYERWRVCDVWEETEIVDSVSFCALPRGVALPDLQMTEPRLCGVFDFEIDESIKPSQAFLVDKISEPLQIPLENRPAYQCSKLKPKPFRGTFIENNLIIDGIAGLFYDFMQMYSGFPHLYFTCDQDMTVDIIHGDRLNQTDGSLPPRGGETNNVIRLKCKPGTYDFTAFEPYGIRWMHIIFRGSGCVKLQKVGLRKYQYKDNNACSFLCSDAALNRIFESAKTTFLTNTIDVFMDCPGRERGGWYCDSFFTSRSERYFTANSCVNRSMLENAVHSPVTIGEFFPQLYPAETAVDRVGLIPNWSMFVVLQFCEYIRMTNDTEFLALAKDRMLRSVTDLTQYENEIGLLENLPGYVFMDWSCANLDENKNPISVPTNALYARMLDETAFLYNIEAWHEKAETIRKTLVSLASIKQNGSYYYADGIIKTDDGYQNNGKISEAALYYDLWLGLPDRGNLWNALKKEHGPCPENYPANLMIGRSNVFIGLYLRMELLAQTGEHTQMLKEMRHLFGYMIENGPGTLWETLSDKASVDHGFASHAAVWLIRDILGIGIPNEQDKTVVIRPHLADLTWAKGCMQTPCGIISVTAWKENGETKYIASVPKDYTIL